MCVGSQVGVALKIWVKGYHGFPSVLPGSTHHFPFVRTSRVVLCSFPQFVSTEKKPVEQR
jgi:hypothetical protein